MDAGEEIRNKAKEALEKFIASGMDSKEALERVQAEFVNDVVQAMADEINSYGIGTVAALSLMGMAINDIDLSSNLYKNVKKVNADVLSLIKKHRSEKESARDLALKIYEGYDFKTDPLNVKKDLPKYLLKPLGALNAKRLKTPALKAAYLQTLEATSKNQLRKALKVALYERNRYFANRIAQTELHRIQTKAKSLKILNDDKIEVVQIKLSRTHPKFDVCDYHAELNAYGLGKGCYPKAKAPMPPFHPFCKCIVSPRVDLKQSDAKLDEQADDKFRKGLTGRQQKELFPAQAMFERWKSGESAVNLFDSYKKPYYRTKTMGELADVVIPDTKRRELLAPTMSAEEAQSLSRKEWIRLAKTEHGAIVIGLLGSEAASLIGSETREILLSGETLEKQRSKHPDLLPEHYLSIIDDLSRYEVLIRHSSGKKLMFFKRKGKLYEAVIKATQKGHEMYLVSMYRTEESKIDSEILKGEIIADNRNK